MEICFMKPLRNYLFSELLGHIEKLKAVQKMVEE